MGVGGRGWFNSGAWFIARELRTRRSRGELRGRGERLARAFISVDMHAASRGSSSSEQRKKGELPRTAREERRTACSAGLLSSWVDHCEGESGEARGTAPALEVLPTRAVLEAREQFPRSLGAISYLWIRDEGLDARCRAPFSAVLAVAVLGSSPSCRLRRGPESRRKQR